MKFYTQPINPGVIAMLHTAHNIWQIYTIASMRGNASNRRALDFTYLKECEKQEQLLVNPNQQCKSTVIKGGLQIHSHYVNIAPLAPDPTYISMRNDGQE